MIFTFSRAKFLEKQGQKRPIDTPKRMIERREIRERERRERERDVRDI